jgi:hypothetical protein
MMVPIPEGELDSVFQGEYTMLVFTDAAFFISDLHKPEVQGYYQQNRKLPYKVQAVRFVPVNVNREGVALADQDTALPIVKSEKGENHE